MLAEFVVAAYKVFVTVVDGMMLAKTPANVGLKFASTRLEKFLI